MSAYLSTRAFEPIGLSADGPRQGCNLQGWNLQGCNLQGWNLQGSSPRVGWYIIITKNFMKRVMRETTAALRHYAFADKENG